MKPWIKDLQKELVSIYGPSASANMLTGVIPGILGDFCKLINQAAPGAEVSEEYRLDDGKAVIQMTGARIFGLTEAMDMIQEIRVNDKVVWKN